MQKVDRHIIYDDFIKAVLEIERSDIPQKEKTRRLQAAASRVRNALFYDKRKFGNQKRAGIARNEGKRLLTELPAYATLLNQLIAADTEEQIDFITQELIETSKENHDHTALNAFAEFRKRSDPRLAISTYRSYITELKNKMRDKNMRHHSLPIVIARYKKQYPAYTTLLDRLNTEDANTAGLIRLKLIELAQENTDQMAYAAFTKIKTDHEATRHLFVDHMEKAILEREQAESLNYRKTHTIKINPDSVTALITALLTEMTWRKNKKPPYSHLAIGLALATGRRAVEVLYTGAFETTDNNALLLFTGQAKKRPGMAQTEKMLIPILADADIILAGLAQLRASPEMVSLHKRAKAQPTEREGRAEINRTAANLNSAIKRMFGDNFTFKDTRAIYSRMVCDRFFRTGIWKDVDEDEFFRQILGHDDYDTIKSYKRIQLDKDGINLSTFANQVDMADDLVDAIQNLDLSKQGRGMNSIHQFVCFIVENAPGTPITQTLLNKKAGELLQRLKSQNIAIPEHLASVKAFGRPTVQKYLDFSDAVIAPYNTACVTE
ncbi:protelomerase family protein [Thiothrix lacustris]|uniref:Protelomerase family protein n=1 Tax=Thiothrix lacustris TaxID=525917 RepID=A0ABY9MQ56_9GAMM|nr:protelomerase family protein [Thiothrix lacustris]WML90789.1 protelomerase family protein [Thiothrix lacustris]